MVYNKTTTIFSHWLDELKHIAGIEYNLSLGFNFHEQVFYHHYSSGMDVHEAIKTYQETLTENEK